MFFKNFNPGVVKIPVRSIDETIRYAKIGGFKGIDLNVEHAEEAVREGGTDAIKAKMSEAGLQFGGWPLPVEWRKTEEQFFSDLAKLPAQAKLAADIGCTRCYTFVFGWSDEKTRKEQFDFLVYRFRLIAEVLRGYGCSLGLEFIGPLTQRKNARYGCVYTMDAMLAIACAIGTGNVGLLLDCWHWYTALSTVTDLRQLVADEVVYIHVNDAPKGIDVLEQIDTQRALPGETDVIDIKGFLGAMKEIGYEGPVTPEPFSEKINTMQDKEEAARILGRSMDDIWKKAGLA